MNILRVTTLPSQKSQVFFPHICIILWKKYKFLNKIIFVFFPYGNLCRKFATCFCSHHLPFNYEKVKVRQGNKTIVNIGDQISVTTNFTQFAATICAEHWTPWQWSKIVKMMTLVWRMQVWKISQINATSATLHLLIKAIWEHIWKRTVEKSQTNATTVTTRWVSPQVWRSHSFYWEVFFFQVAMGATREEFVSRYFQLDF